MATRKVMLRYPESLIQQPLLYQMARRFDVIPNIRRARVTDTVGEIAVELEGSDSDLDHGVAYLQEQGVLVQPIEGDIVSP